MMLFVAAIALINIFRGRGIIPKPFTSALCGLYAGLCSGSLYAGIIVAMGVYFWCIWGWGKYFSCFRGVDDPNETEIRWIDWIGYKLFPPSPQDRSTNLRRGFVCMTLRGFYLLPMYVALAVFVTPYALLGLPAAFLQGASYSVMRYVQEKNSVAYAEVLFGLIIGLSLLPILN